MESMDDYKDLLEASFKQFRAGDVVKGTIISVDEEGAIVDLEYFAPGKIPADSFSDDPKFSVLENVHVGDKVTATVVKKDDGAGNILLSTIEASHELAWEKFAKYKNEKTVVKVKITEAVKAGVIAYLEGIKAFIPASRLELHYVEDLAPYVGKEVEAVVETVDSEDEKLVLSCREPLRAKLEDEKASAVKRLQVGNIVEGTVESLKEYGAFVDIGEGVSGLVHISEIPFPKKLVHPKYAVSVGDKVTVKITKIADGKVSLSMKDIHEALDTEVDAEPVEYIDKDSEGFGTSMGDLFKNFKF